MLIEDGHVHLARIEASHEAAAARLRDATERRVAEFRASGALVDWPCDWVHVPYGEGIPEAVWHASSGPVPYSYQWDAGSARWGVHGVSGRLADPK